jgi:sirohydrochlorin cobaltochelatase
VHDRAIVLLGHGSPAAAWSRPLLALQRAIVAREHRVRVRVAFLAPASPTLPEVVGALVSAGYRDVLVAPVFLSAGGRHLQHDVPAQVTALRQAWPCCQIALAEALGEDADVLAAMAGAVLRFHVRAST